MQSLNAAITQCNHSMPQLGNAITQCANYAMQLLNLPITQSPNGLRSVALLELLAAAAPARVIAADLWFVAFDGFDRRIVSPDACGLRGACNRPCCGAT